jgi:predicted secreted Zn-dependent protease
MPCRQNAGKSTAFRLSALAVHENVARAISVARRFSLAQVPVKQGCVMIRMLFAASLVGLFALPVSAETLTKTYSYFSVGGRTLGELEAELNKRGPKVKSTGQRHPGATQMNFNTRIGYAEKNGSCRIGEATVTVKAKVILPRWRQRAGADPDARLVWDTLSVDIKRHEEQHVRIARDYARQLERKLLRLGRQKNCAVAAQKAKATADALLAKHDRAQARFDRSESASFERRLLRLMRERINRIEAGEIAG